MVLSAVIVSAIGAQAVLAAVGIGAAIALVVFAVASQAEEKATVRASLRQLEGYEVEDVRDQELLKPVTERAIMPAMKGLTDIGRRLTPTGYVDQIRLKHTYAGEPSADAVDRFLAIRVVTVVLGVVGALYIMVAQPLDGGLNLAVAGFWLLIFILGPDAQLNRKVEERQLELRRKLPDILDLLTISVEAGLGFEQALDRTVSAVPGPLSDEFARMLGEVRAGASRADAMRSLEARANVPEIRSFVLAILQADTFGVSIGRVLRSQADEMRIKRRQLAQEMAQKAPVKMLIPMVFCVFPALFVVVLAPAVLNILDNF
jgi:tight adherence protein C